MDMRTIRDATESDKELLVDLFVSEVADDSKMALAFADDLLRFKTILCVMEDNVIGTVSWDIRGGLDDGVVELIGLGVNPDYRRQGVAKELVQTLIHEASKHYADNDHRLRVIYLFMEKENDVGRSFYQSMGFKEVAEIPALYPHDDASIWTLHL
ncbi:MAG: GNAT family N-acetyltransferase [Candidatus Thorarchaeota archaeon]